MKRESAPASVKRSSASRYWSARLQVLKRPAVWGSALLLLLPLVFLANYWRDPEGFVGSQALLQSESSALPEEQNISNSPTGDGTTAPAVSDASTLLEVPALPDPETGARQTDLPQPTLLESLLSMPLPGLESQPQPASRPRSPFTTQPRNSESSQNRVSNGAGNVSAGLFSSSSPLLTSALAQPTANPEGNAATTSSNQAGSNQVGMPLSPLQSALNRSAGIGVSSSPSTSEAQPESPSNLTAQAPANPGQTTLPWLVTGQISQPLGTPTFGTPTYIPRTSPFPGTTGYTLPSALRPTLPYSAAPTYSNYANSYFNNAYPGVYPSTPYTGFPVGTVTPSIYPTVPQLTPTLPISPYGRPGYSTGIPVPSFTPATTSIPQPVPFSIPRTPPGRYIGGGEINTFSNP